MLALIRAKNKFTDLVMDAPENVVYNLDSLLFQGVCSLVKYYDFNRSMSTSEDVWAPCPGLIPQGKFEGYKLSRQLQHLRLDAPMKHPCNYGIFPFNLP